MKRCLACGVTFPDEPWHCPRCGHEPVRLGSFTAFAPALADTPGGYEPGHFAKLYQLEASHFWFRARNGLIQWALRRHFPNARSLCEIGCGTGFVLSGLQEAAPQLRLAASEIFAEGLPFAQSRVPGARLFQMDARSIPFEDEFDVIGAFDVIEHVEEDTDVLCQMHRALKPGGGLLLTVPQHPWLWSAADEVAHHVRRYTASDLRQKVLDAGFRIARVTSFVSLLLPLMLLSRRARPGKNPDPYDELRIGPVSNALLSAVMTVERALIRMGVSFPAGGSLLLAARRPER
ncbi:MAG: methyltransferase domain-containing protein [Betaproteobacteria bacterium]|nr:methyltransferase domain-containing protein [Betaproteobacteria bacterium]MDH3436672.1 methyltransferase domain-containing protein [Betaproteobacteria bacterium]